MARKKQTVSISPEQPVASSVILTDIPEYMVSSYYQYISYIASGRIACNIFDGFKNIYRRILYASSKLCRDHNVKSNRLSGDVSGKYSPHGDCYTSIVKAVQNGMLIGRGNFGNSMGVEVDGPGAPRYTEVRLNPISEVIFMNRELMPYVPYIETEMSKEEDRLYEPLFLPVLLPGIYTALAPTAEFDNNMALKLSLIYPRYAVLSLLNYVLKYLKEGVWDPSLLYYQFHNIVKQATTDIQSKFEVEFKAPASEDEDGNVHLLSTLPLVQMDVMLKNIPYEDHTTYKTDISFAKKYFSNKFKKLVKFNVKGYRLIENDYQNVILHDYPIRYSIEIILNTLKTYLFPNCFKDKEQKILDKIKEHELLKSVREKYVNQNISYDQMTKEEQAVAAKHYSSTFMTIEDKIQQLNEDLNVIRKRAQNIDGEILNLYEDAREKTSKYLAKYMKDSKIQIYDVTNI